MYYVIKDINGNYSVSDKVINGGKIIASSNSLNELLMFIESLLQDSKTLNNRIVDLT